MTFTRATLRMYAGVIVWGLHFGVLYAMTAYACARGGSWVQGAVLAAGIVAGIACVFLMVRGWRRRERFEEGVAAGVAALALLAIVWETIPVFLVPSCG